MRGTATRRVLAGLAMCAIGLGSVGVGSASAGEVTGNGQSLKNPDGTLNGASICAFSGRNDTYSGDPDVPDADGFTRTQNWGSIDKETRDFLTTIGLQPGDSCNPTKGFEE